MRCSEATCPFVLDLSVFLVPSAEADFENPFENSEKIIFVVCRIFYIIFTCAVGRRRVCCVLWGCLQVPIGCGAWVVLELKITLGTVYSFLSLCFGFVAIGQIFKDSSSFHPSCPLFFPISCPLIPCAGPTNMGSNYGRTVGS